MKKLSVFIILLFLFSFSSCCTEEVNWPGYAGTMDGYEYCHTDDRDRAWEEDILSFAENFLSNHPKLVNEETKMFIADTSAAWQNLFDEEAYRQFIDGVNQLIQNIPNLSDTEVVFQIQAVIASLDDAHSVVDIPIDPFFPLMLLEFYTDAGVEIRAVSVPAELENLIYAKLASINGVAIGDVLERIYPYLSFENEYWALYQCTHDTGGMWLTNRDLLRTIGVVDEDSDTAIFEFLTDDGEAVAAELTAVSLADYRALERADFSEYKTYSLLYTDWVTKNYWYEMLPEEDALYIRIARFAEAADRSLLEMSEQMIDDIGATEGVDKVIVDLRNNIGGGAIEGYERLFQALSLKNIGKVYVLIDSGTFSRGVIAAYRIRQEIDGAVVVGTPAAHGSYLFALTENSYFTMPNCQINYFIGAQKDIIDPDSQYDAFMPDILVYPTIEDYRRGVDTVLNYVLTLP